ncbi:MAG: NfeD family protein [Planctomycetaceae bacterium]|nr:NfeD family protein [Planctomycetaceae bacterium]
MGTDTLEFIYLVCFFLGLGFAVLCALLSGLFSGHVGGHVDTGGFHDGGFHGDSHGLHTSATDGPVHYSPLSPVTIAMFVSTFGGTGILVKRFVDPRFYIHLPLAAVAGVVVAGIISYIFYKILSTTQSTSHSRPEEAIGLEAEVTVPIPNNGLGEIAYTVRGTRLTNPAQSTDGKELPARLTVKIIKQVGTTFIVQKVQG